MAKNFNGNQAPFGLRVYRKLWTKLLGRESWLRSNGTLRERIGYGLVERGNHAYGLLRAADTAAYFGFKSTTVCEFGVARGWGLSNIVEVGNLISRETGIKFNIFGFDTGAGLPPPQGYKDHPELWSQGDFSMGEPGALQAKLGSSAKLILGDIAETIDPFVRSLSAESPVGFVSIDVDIYSGTVSAFRLLRGSPELYLPAMSFYFDDVLSYFSNFGAGELCAIREHNASHPMRILDEDHSLPLSTHTWRKQMYVCHVLDHPARNHPMERPALGLLEHLKHMGGLT